MVAEYSEVERVQSIIVQENKLVYFVLCSAHSLNLVGAESVEACVEAQTYFGIVPHSLQLPFMAQHLDEMC